MNGKRLVITLVLVVLGAFALVGVVAAQDDTPPVPRAPYGGCGYGDCQYNGDWQRGYSRGRGMMGGFNAGWMHEYMLSTFADVLGLDPSKIESQVEAGVPMWEIAADNGLSEAEFEQAMLDAREEALARAVEDGLIDQEWAAWMLERMGGMYSGGFRPGNGGCRGGGRGHWQAAPENPDGNSG